MKKVFRWKRNSPDIASCYDCGAVYHEWPDVLLSDELWEKINPSYHKRGGLLCPTCMCFRLSKIATKLEDCENITINIYAGEERKYI